MLNPDFSILNWRPFLELHAIEKLLKRIVYGRHYSKPSDLFFQDHKWQAWARAHESKPPTGRTKPSISPPPSFWDSNKPIRDARGQIIDDSRDGNYATDKQREGAYAFYLTQFHAHRASPANSNDIDITMSNLEEMLGDRLTHDEGWDNPAPSKEVLR
jgi:hypothetical protein